MDETWPTQENLHILLGNKIPRIINLVHEQKGYSFDEATELFYNSTLYKNLENIETGLWGEGVVPLYREFINEIES